MFDLAKYILTKVSFDLKLFEKELAKFLKRLKEDERQLLIGWCLNNFGSSHQEIIRKSIKK